MADYAVGDKKFADYFESVAHADKVKADVVEIATGIVRWTPAPPVDKKKLRLYAHRRAAYEAQCRMLGITPKPEKVEKK